MAIWNRLRRWLHDIPIDDPLARRQAIPVQNMLIGLIAIILISLPLEFISLDADHYWLLSTLTLLLIICYTALVLVILRRGHFRAAIMMTTLSLILALALFLLQLGVRGNGSLLLGFALPITLAGMLSGRRSLWFAVGLSALVVFSIALLEHLSIWQPSNVILSSGLVLASDFLMVAVLLGLFLDGLSTSLREALAMAATRERALEREIAERQRVEAALRESEERYRLIAEHTSDLIGLYDLNDSARRLYASPSHTAMLGYEPDDLARLAPNDLVHPEDLPAVAEYQQQLFGNGAATATYRLRHASGSWVWVESHATIIAQEGQTYALMVDRDVSERKHLEAQLMQSQRLESVGRLAGGVAHDFNNLLTAIMGNTDLARDSLPAGHPARGDLDEITKSSARAAELTRQLLAFGRKQIIEPHVIDLNQLILDMDKLLRRLIGAHIDLIVLTDPDLWRVRADRGQIEQIVVNLAVNACDAMPGGGTLTIEIRNVRLDHDYAHRHISVSPGCYVMLAISDTGTGMDEQTQAQIFEPFFTTKAPGRGTGLGLATCYGIVKQHGGSIWPYSEPGHGSTFKVYLPRVEAPAEDPTSPAADDDLPRGTETILLAEDEPSVRMLAARVLRSQGYTVIEAENGDAALQVAHGWAGPPIGLLLTDVVMPRMSGKALAERIQALFPASAVLFISGYTDNAIVQHGQLEPGIVFLQKPFSPAALARKVRQVLDSGAG